MAAPVPHLAGKRFAWLLPHEEPTAPHGAFVYTAAAESSGGEGQSETVFLSLKGPAPDEIEQSYEQAWKDLHDHLIELEHRRGDHGGDRGGDRGDHGSRRVGSAGHQVEQHYLALLECAYALLLDLTTHHSPCVAEAALGTALGECEQPLSNDGRIVRLLEQVTECFDKVQHWKYTSRRRAASESDGPHVVPHDVYHLVNGDVDVLFDDPSKVVDDPNCTPMRCAVQAGQHEVARVLIRFGADLRRRPRAQAGLATKVGCLPRLP